MFFVTYGFICAVLFFSGKSKNVVLLQYVLLRYVGLLVQSPDPSRQLPVQERDVDMIFYNRIN